MSGFLKTVWKNSTRATRALSDIKIKSKVSAFFLHLLVYLPLIALLSLLFARLQGINKA